MNYCPAISCFFLWIILELMGVGCFHLTQWLNYNWGSAGQWWRPLWLLILWLQQLAHQGIITGGGGEFFFLGGWGWDFVAPLPAKHWCWLLCDSYISNFMGKCRINLYISMFSFNVRSKLVMFYSNMWVFTDFLLLLLIRVWQQWINRPALTCSQGCGYLSILSTHYPQSHSSLESMCTDKVLIQSRE